MTEDDKKPRIAESGSETNNLFLVFRTLGDTTWRMFAPVILGALFGWWFDEYYVTNFGALTGSIMGLVVAGLLVWQQYVSVSETKK